MTDVLVSSKSVEVIRTVPATGRVSSLDVEVIRGISTPRPLSASSFNVEVLRSYIPPAPPPSGGGVVLCVFSG